MSLKILFFNLLLEDPKAAFESLAANLNDDLLSHEDFMIFLIKQLMHYKVESKGLTDKLVQTKSPKTHKDLLLLLSEHAQPNQAVTLLKTLYENHPSDKVVQARYLNLLVETNLQEAVKVQQKLQ